MYTLLNILPFLCTKYYMNDLVVYSRPYKIVVQPSWVAVKFEMVQNFSKILHFRIRNDNI